MAVVKNIEWVVNLKLEDGTHIRGVQKAWYGHPAMEFFAKRLGVKSVASNAEKMDSFLYFLEQGHRSPLTPEELAR